MRDPGNEVDSDWLIKLRIEYGNLDKSLIKLKYFQEKRKVSYYFKIFLLMLSFQSLG